MGKNMAVYSDCIDRSLIWTFENKLLFLNHSVFTPFGPNWAYRFNFPVFGLVWHCSMLSFITISSKMCTWEGIESEDWQIDTSGENVILTFIFLSKYTSSFIRLFNYRYKTAINTVRSSFIRFVCWSAVIFYNQTADQMLTFDCSVQIYFVISCLVYSIVR